MKMKRFLIISGGIISEVVGKNKEMVFRWIQVQEKESIQEISSKVTIS